MQCLIFIECLLFWENFIISTGSRKLLQTGVAHLPAFSCLNRLDQDVARKIDASSLLDVLS